jgi:hypothetical protein
MRSAAVDMTCISNWLAHQERAADQPCQDILQVFIGCDSYSCSLRWSSEQPMKIFIISQAPAPGTWRRLGAVAAISTRVSGSVQPKGPVLCP